LADRFKRLPTRRLYLFGVKGKCDVLEAFNAAVKTGDMTGLKDDGQGAD
jgi:hypothetical protein